MFLEDLCKLSGVAAFEHPVRKFIINKLDEAKCNYMVDRLGNIIVNNDGDCDKKVMLISNMDEAGLMVSGFDSNGYLKFKKIGDINIMSLNSCDVEVGENKIKGVIGVKPIHVMKFSDRGKITSEIESMRIDIGANTKEEAMKVVSIGDSVVFPYNYRVLGKNISCKALDVRSACSILLEIVLSKPSFGFTAVFSVMSRIENKGAIATSNRIKPDVCINIVGAECADFSGILNENIGAKLGNGPCLFIKDMSIVYDIDLIRNIMELSKKNNIKSQLYTYTKRSKSDAYQAVINKQGSKGIVIGIPCRYISSPIPTISSDDYDSTKALVNMLIEIYSKGDISYAI